MYRRLIKVAFLLFLITFCVIFFFVVHKVKEPALAFGLLDYMKELKIDSVIFECLENSFIPQEIPKSWQLDSSFDSGGDFAYFKYYPKYPPLLNIKTLLPIEMYLSREEQEVPFAEQDLVSKPNFSWSFAVDKKNKIYSIDAAKMTPGEDEISGKVEDGLMLWKKGSVRQAVELSDGSKEFSIIASNASNFQPNSQFDPHMSAYLDNALIGSVFVRDKNLANYDFHYYTTEGWHKFEIEFDNAYYDKEKLLDSNLLIKEVQIYELIGGVCLGARKGLEENLSQSKYMLSYFRSLPGEKNNQLIRFFKSRFNIDNLRNISMEGYKIQALVEDVEIAGLIKKAIFAPAPTEIRLKVKVPIDGIKVTFGFGIMEEVWDKAGDGVLFRVRMDTKKDEPEEVLFSQYINPKANEKDRKWFIAEVDLKKYKGKEATLVFETIGSMPSPIRPTIDDAYDWAVWSG